MFYRSDVNSTCKNAGKANKSPEQKEDQGEVGKVRIPNDRSIKDLNGSRELNECDYFTGREVCKGPPHLSTIKLGRLPGEGGHWGTVGLAKSLGRKHKGHEEIM